MGISFHPRGGKPSTGKPYAGNPPVRFGGRGGRVTGLPYPYREAEKVLAKLKKGEDFSQLAKEYSIDLPMAKEGGAMGTIEKGKGLPELEKVLFVLKVGEISDIVETRYGFHILTVDEIITTQYRPFEEVKESIRKGLLQQKEAKAFDEMAANLEKNAKIKIFEENLQTAK